MKDISALRAQLQIPVAFQSCVNFEVDEDDEDDDEVQDEVNAGLTDEAGINIADSSSNDERNGEYDDDIHGNIHNVPRSGLRGIILPNETIMSSRDPILLTGATLSSEQMSSDDV